MDHCSALPCHRKKWFMNRASLLVTETLPTIKTDLNLIRAIRFINTSSCSKSKYILLLYHRQFENNIFPIFFWWCTVGQMTENPPTNMFKSCGNWLVIVPYGTVWCDLCNVWHNLFPLDGIGLRLLFWLLQLTTPFGPHWNLLRNHT